MNVPDLQDELATALGPSYRVTRELGAAGMSRVFVVEERSLEREIVVKVLPPELAAGLSTERFRTEIQHAARLQHPHIVPVLSAGVMTFRTGGQGPYYTMPRIRGESLRDRLVREPVLPPAVVRRLLVDVVEALAHAHEHGIVHRDIKPENILVSGNHAFVTDFGVSKAITTTALARPATMPGFTLGTPGYMAPEQAVADPDLDHRADLYSVGIVAYEALSGRRPFSGTTLQELLAAQIGMPPEPLSRVAPAVPSQLAGLVMRCVERDPARRFASAAELLAALESLPGDSQPTLAVPVPNPPARRRWLWAAGIGLVALAAAAWGVGEVVARRSGAAGTPRSTSLAVIPRELTRSGVIAPEQLELLTEDVSNDLSRMDGLRMVSYLSALALLSRGQPPTLREIGRTLGADHLLTFVSRRVGGGVRLTAQLVDARTDAVLWSEPYVVDTAGFDELHKDIVRKVSARLLGTDMRLVRLPSHYAAARRDAELAYRRGLRAVNLRTPDSVAQAVRSFEEALALDTAHAPAAARLSSALALQLSYGYRTAEPAWDAAARALALAERALALDSSLSEAYVARGYLAYLVLAPPSVIRPDFERAMALRPTSSDLSTWNALLLQREGHAAAALAEARKAIDADPLSPARRIGLALAAIAMRRYDDAVREARKALELQPTLDRPRQVEAVALLLLGRAEECVRLDQGPHRGIRALCLRVVGRDADAQALVGELELAARAGGTEGEPFSEVVPAQELAYYFAGAGDPGRALRWLRAAYERSPAGVDTRLVESGLFDSVLSAPGFASELARLRDASWPRIRSAVTPANERPDDTTGF
ncbi:MAG: protein kinase domain-containing protein [Gemmatimonadales bacterium]